MQSQIRKAIGFAVVLLLLAVSLMAAVTVHAEAPANYHEITVIVEGGDSTCKIVWTGVDTLDGKYCRDGRSITVRAIAGDGYELDYMVRRDAGGDETYIPHGTSEVTESAVTSDLTFIAHFKPKVYTLDYISNEADASIATSPALPKSYTYGENAFELYIPQDTPAYRFVGWYEGENAIKVDSEGKYWYKPSTVPAGDKIILTARFEPKEIGGSRVDRDWLTKERISTEDVLYTTWKYRDRIVADENLKDPDGTFRQYPGYTFITGDTKYYTEITVSATQKLNEVTRYYVPNVYQITFDACGGILPDPDSVTASVTYNQKIADLAAGKLPTREGYSFAGYYSERDGRGTRYIDPTGAGSVWNIAENTTLYAYWVAEEFEIDFSESLTANATVTVRLGTNTYTYDGTPLSFAYGTTVTITVTAGDGYKLVSWNGQAIAHTKTHTLTFTVAAENVELAGIVLPVCTVPAFEVDYINERLTVEGGIPSGRYALRAGGTDYAFAGDDPLSLSNWFGSTVQILCYGDGVTKADSEWVDLVLAARPAMPTLVDGKGNGTVEKPGTDETGVTLTVTDGDTVAYEFACARNSGEKLTWQDSGVFTGLNAGTTYTFYIRIKATETAPHGEEFSISVYTLNEKFLQGEIESLRSNSDGGENVNAVIERYVTLMEAVKPGANYVNEIEALKNECLAKLAFARYQDQEIAKIRSRCEELKGQKLYNAEGEKQLESLRDTAITAICNAATKDGVDNARKAFDAGVEDIPVRIDLTGLLISLGVVILLQIIALIILLARRAKYADYVKIHRGSRVYGFALPVLALSAQFLPEKTALIALLLGILALGLQTVIMVLIFRTAAIAKSGKKQENSPTPPTNPTPAPQGSQTEYGDAFAPHLSVFRDEDAPTFAGDDADELQEEDWYDDGAADEEPSANSFSPDDSENDD